jgi:hydroxymethylpyrimidine pyrophosphatase-like HAD family hydrolase
VTPDIEITCSGALVKYRGNCVYKAEFTPEETKRLIQRAGEICGSDTEITVDTMTGHYWNYKQDPKLIYHDWGECIHTDYRGFADSALKICVEVFDPVQAQKLAEEFPDCDCTKFMDGAWYKFTKKTATKESAVSYLSKECQIPLEQVIAFGDDLVDVGMLACCGMGVAMGNALDAVKEAADVVIGSNDEDGIADFLEKMCG